MVKYITSYILRLIYIVYVNIKEKKLDELLN